jgi:hypothetical protein
MYWSVGTFVLKEFHAEMPNTDAVLSAYHLLGIVPLVFNFEFVSIVGIRLRFR